MRYDSSHALALPAGASRGLFSQIARMYPNGDDIALIDWDPAWSETVWDARLDRRLDAFSFEVIHACARPALLNLALDAVLLQRVAEGRRPPTLWIWDWFERAVIIGSYQSVSDTVDTAVASEHGFAIARRISGGGAMVVEPDRTLTYSLLVPESAVDGLSFVQSFAFLDRWLVRALRSLGVPATYRPINDIASPTAKIGGAAQCRRKRTVLHHATLAWDLDGALMSALLRHGQPAANPKGVPSAEKRVSPLSLYTDLSRQRVLDWLPEAFARMHQTHESDFTPGEIDDARRLIDEKFGTRDWLYRVT